MKCPSCGSSQVRTRIKTAERVCNKCGKAWPANINAEQKPIAAGPKKNEFSF